MVDSLKVAADRPTPDTLSTILQKLGLGGLLRALPTTLRKSGTAAGSYILATARLVSKQAQDAPAASISSAFARAGSGTPAALTIVATNPPAAGQISIAPNGSIQTAAADVWTDLDVTYVVEKGDIVEVTLPVVTNALALPTFITARGAVLLLEVEALVGTLVGKKIIDAPGAAPAAGHAAINTAKTSVAFQATDAVTSARVKLLIASAIDVSAELSADSTII